MIGVIDSGVGGISVLLEMHQRMPRHSYYYIADSKWCPYGSKSSEEIQKRVFFLADFLIEKGAEMIVIACNSATISAVEALRAHYPIQFIGMEPAVKPASEITQTHTIGVLATQASLNGEKFHRLVNTHATDLRVIIQQCPKFTELVEQGALKGPEVESAIHEYTHEMIQEGVDTIILGCTHYTFLKPALIKILPSHIKLIDTGNAVAKRVANLKPSPSSNPRIHAFTTGSKPQLDALLPLLCPELEVKTSAL